MLEDLSPADRIKELEADNRRLRRLLEQRDAPQELRHRLRSTLGMLRTIIRKSAETGRTIEDHVAHLEDRLDTIMRAQAYADERGSIELHTLIVDELFHYHISEGERALLSGPDLELQPRTGQLLALAIHELAVNAVEHGTLDVGEGRLEVDWTVSGTGPDGTLTLHWKEHGAEKSPVPSRSGLGTEVLTRMLRYELKADTSLTFEPDGLRCTINFPLLGPAT